MSLKSVSIAVMILLLVLMATPAAVTPRTPSSSPTASPSSSSSLSEPVAGAPCGSQANTESTSVNLASAVHAALESPVFQTESAKFINVTYYSKFEITKWSNSTSCIAQGSTYNVVFSATNSSGFDGYIVASENPQTLSVLGVTEQPHMLQNELHGDVGVASTAQSINPSANPDPPLSVDGSTSAFCSHNTNSCQATLTTTNSFDVIIVYTLEELDLQTSCTFSVSDTAGLAWTLRASASGRNDGTTGSNRDQIGEFWATSVNPLSSDVITESISGCAGQYGGEYNALQAFGVSGANFNDPFDAKGSLPTTSSAYSNSPSVTIATGNANDMIISAAQQSSYGVLTAGSGFSTIIQGGTGRATTEYEILNSVENSFQVSFGDSATWYWELIADAIQAGTSGSYASHNYWSGYQILADSSQDSKISAAATTFYQPSASYPPTGCAGFYSCIFSTWVGLSDNNGNLAQDGTEAFVENGGGVIYYQAWYEMLPAGAITCTGSNQVIVHSGDEIFTDTQNEAINGGSSTTYDFYIFDYTSNTSCQVTGQYYNMPNAPHADYIQENSEWKPYSFANFASLAEFGSVTFSSTELMEGANYFSYIYPLYSQGLDFGFYIANAPCNANCGYPPANNIQCGNPVTNVSTGSVSPSSSFTSAWKSSQYTPYWNSGC
jgi:hypothetical protein